MAESKKLTIVQKIKSFPIINYSSGPSKDYAQKNMSVKISAKLSSLVQQKNNKTSMNKQTICSQSSQRYGYFREEDNSHRWSCLKQNGSIVYKNSRKGSHRENGQQQNIRIRPKITIEPKSSNTDRSIVKNEKSSFNQKPKKQQKNSGNQIAFGAKCHIGLKNSKNQDRMHIVTSLKKTESTNDLSFFGIFVAKNGITKAQYYRDNFYKFLSTDPLLFKDPERALSKTYQIIEKQYLLDELSNGDYSSVFFIILIFINTLKREEIYLFQLGDNQAFISTNFGQKILKPFRKKFENFHEAAHFSSILEYHRIQNSNKSHKPSIEKIADPHHLDFIVIASSDFFSRNKEEKYAKEIWRHLLTMQKNRKIQKIDNSMNTCYESLREKMKSIVNKIMSEKIMDEAGNYSLIVVGMNKLQECFEKELSQFELPFLGQKTLLIANQ